jgi:hypothetical protein
LKIRSVMIGFLFGVRRQSEAATAFWFGGPPLGGAAPFPGPPQGGTPN